MTPGLLFPLALFALAAVIAPLVIHIARRSEQQPTDFAALRWLRQKPRPRSRLRFDEWPLLLLRLLLLILLAVWLARPVLTGVGEDRVYVAVAPGVDPAEAARLAQAVGGGEGAAHWLAPGFPSLDQPRPIGPSPVASLVRQLDADLPADVRLTIVVPRQMAGADAERPRLSRAVAWRVVPGAAPGTAPAKAEPPGLSIRHDAAQASAVRYLRAAAATWRPAGQDADIDVAAIDAPLPTSERALVWLGAGTPPPTLIAWVQAGGTVLAGAAVAPPSGAGETVVLWRDTLGRPLVEASPMGAGRFMRLTRSLTPSDTPELLEADFPGRLRGLFDAPVAAPTRVAAADYQPVVGGPAYVQAPRDLRPWLAGLIVLALLAERWLATRRRRGIAP